MEEKVINLQVKLAGNYMEAFVAFKRNNKTEGRTNTSAILELIRRLPEFQELLGVKRKRK